MALFKKPNRKFRQRVTRTDSDEEESQTDVIEIKKSTSSKINATESGIKSTFSTPVNQKENVSRAGEKHDIQTVKAPTKLLSFHDEEDEGEVFKLKKTNHSRRLAKQMERERKKKQEMANSLTVTDSKPNDSKDNIPKETKESNVVFGKEAEDMDVDNDEDDDTKDAENPFKNILQSGMIPDAATIYAMKKHRQMAREMGDFIPLENVEQDEDSKSRLIREDDNDRSDDDDDEPSRLSFAVNTAAIERQKAREAFLSLQEESHGEIENEDAAELERWEREQIRKGVNITTPVGMQQTQQMSENEFYSYVSSSVEERALFPPTDQNSNAMAEKSFLSSMQNAKTDLTTSSIKARLEERLLSLKQLHKAHEEELEACQKEIIQANDLIEQIEIEEPEAASRYTLYQEMRGYVEDLVECLDLKVAHIQILESKMLTLYKTRSKNLISRRQQDVKDQADEYASLSYKILKGSCIDMPGEKNGLADEGKLRRAAEREGRRMRRRKIRERTVLPAKHHEGMSSDDEETDLETIRFKDKKEHILQEAEEIFEDVIEEFGTLKGVIFTFERWRHEQSESYCEAFVPLCLPKIFGPFVRVEMLAWDPLQASTDIETMNWYRTLIYYGFKDIESEGKIVFDDPDVNLLPAIIEKNVLPKITAFIENVWDPLSSKETGALIDLISQICESHPTINGKSKQLQALLRAVYARLNTSLDDDIFIPIYPKEMLENRSVGSSLFFQRQFWSTIKLLNNIIMWEGLLAENPIKDMALTSLLNKYLLMGLNTSIIIKDTLEKCRAIVASFPRTWFADNKDIELAPYLKPFSQFLVKYAQSLPPQKTNEYSEDVKEQVREVVQILISIGSLQDAVVLAKQFSISGLKKV